MLTTFDGSNPLFGGPNLLLNLSCHFFQEVSPLFLSFICLGFELIEVGRVPLLDLSIDNRQPLLDLSDLTDHADKLSSDSFTLNCIWAGLIYRFRHCNLTHFLTPCLAH